MRCTLIVLLNIFVAMTFILITFIIPQKPEWEKMGPDDHSATSFRLKLITPEFNGTEQWKMQIIFQERRLNGPPNFKITIHFK
jgi:hypothetical protein